MLEQIITERDVRQLILKHEFSAFKKNKTLFNSNSKRKTFETKYLFWIQFKNEN